jgi:catechol 2,3-dioxygenase-like lactoylglutathione lyase family enzyme
MGIQLDHIIVPSHNSVAAAKSLAALLDVPWRESGPGGFAPVYANATLTLDFAEREQFERYHVCFHVGDAEFDAILGRIRVAGIKYRSSPHGDDDLKVNTRLGGKNLYWKDADGHQWEILTVSYARADSPSPGTTTSGGSAEPASPRQPAPMRGQSQ